MKKRYLFIILVLAALVSCSKEDEENKYITQDKEIETFIQTNFPDCPVVVNGGVSRVTVVETTGKMAKKGDSVSFSYTAYILSSGKGIQFAEGEYETVLGKGNLLEGLEKGIEGMKKGEEAYILFSGRYSYRKKTIGAVPSMSALIYCITLHDIN
ncbi:MAG: FKBP-type peptidyl-prolyl cis-trans isomerase [Bacteroidales bacterium]|nr:FKBP-type peptidyl-prolyl cis-trans isomerase [Bacteroidales bacterium]